MVPLIMALKQNITRLLIADDVGVGKTIEALLVARVVWRKEIKRFAIVCLPHLCEQWQDELKNKFGVEAVIIRGGTATSLERQIRTHENIFRAFPFQIILSPDYIKSGNKRQVFIDHCQELIIVDEAHTCAKPAGSNNSQQLRYHLLHDIAKKKNSTYYCLQQLPIVASRQSFNLY